MPAKKSPTVKPASKAGSAASTPVSSKPTGSKPAAAVVSTKGAKATKKVPAAQPAATQAVAPVPVNKKEGTKSKKAAKAVDASSVKAVEISAVPDNAPAVNNAAADSKKGEKKEEPEVMLRRRKSMEQGKAKRDIRLKELRKNKPQGQKVDFKRAERFVKDFRLKEQDRVRFKKAAKTLGKADIPEGEIVLLAIRTTPIKKAHPKTQKILQMLRLKNINTAVFLKANKATQTMLKLVEPYVSWGPPTIKTIKELIFKRGFARVEKKKEPISNNALIKQHLGDHGIICVEDIIHEISTGGPHFREAAGFLWPFKLSSPIVDRTKDEPIPGGNKAEKINEIATIMT